MKAVKQTFFFSYLLTNGALYFCLFSGHSKTDCVVSFLYSCRHLAREWMQMTAMDARTHKASVFHSWKPQPVTFDQRHSLPTLTRRLCLLKAMEESRRLSKNFTVERRPLLWGPPTVSRLRRIAPSVARCNFWLSLLNTKLNQTSKQKKNN